MISEIKNRKSLFIRAFLLVLLLSSITAFAQPQQAKEQKKELKAAQNFLSEAQQSLQKDKFPAAEADYRKAIFLNPKSETAKYNLGTAYYGKKKMQRRCFASNKPQLLQRTKLKNTKHSTIWGILL